MNNVDHALVVFSIRVILILSNKINFYFFEIRNNVLFIYNIITVYFILPMVMYRLGIHRKH